MVLAALCLPGPVPAQAAPQVETTDVRVPVRAEPDGVPVTLDATWYTTGTERRPVLILAHGFGGSKDDLADTARDYAAAGYLVLTYTARGFGASGGRIHLNDPEFEIADLRALIDLAATRPDAQLDRPGDPRLGVTGASYGGAVALMAAAADTRIDAVVPVATWHDLGTALFPNHAPSDRPGPLQQQWIAGFFAAAQRPTPGAPPALDPTCGRFDPGVCRLLLAAGSSGRADAALMAELRRRSPAPTVAGVKAPTLVVQGLADSLFGLDQADATVASLTAAGTPHAVYWTDGGHDQASSNAAADEAAVATWFDTQLRGGAQQSAAFTFPGPRPGRDGQARRYTAPTYPGLAHEPLTLPVESETRIVLTPPGGQPASITRSLGGSFQAYALAALPGQSAAYDTDRVTEQRTVVGAPRVRLRVTASAAEVTLFVSLWQINGATAAQPRPGVAPVRVPVTPGVPTEIDVALPAGTWVLEQGSRWRVLVTSTDSAFANSTLGRVDRVDVVGGLSLPTFTGTRVGSDAPIDPELLGVLIAIGVVVVAVAAWGVMYHRRRVRLPERPELVSVPVVVEGLTKTYSDGHKAVSDVSFRAEPGQVVGLLGPNGAGKTTILRMVLGLIKPDAGGTWVRGKPVAPGAEVLRNVGALVEGPGFQPHLTGRQNLRAYWDATGRPESEAGFDDAVAVAALGNALDRPVKAYSQGMRQRLGIAQAMLGRPELLILDEPTNGLDPPQIAAMRPILRAYAATGRTVVISSHLLAEVERTCTHVVVMDAGKVLVDGPVADLLEGHGTTVLVTEQPVTEAQIGALRAVAGVTSVVAEEDTRIVVEAELSRPHVVAAASAAGLSLVEVTGRRHLEELFLTVIGQRRGSDPDAVETLSDRLRQVRPR